MKVPFVYLLIWTLGACLTHRHLRTALRRSGKQCSDNPETHRRRVANRCPLVHLLRLNRHPKNPRRITSLSFENYLIIFIMYCPSRRTGTVTVFMDDVFMTSCGFSSKLSVHLFICVARVNSELIHTAPHFPLEIFITLLLRSSR